MVDMPAVDVLLATYQGAEFVDELLRSLCAQTVPARIVVRDDGSTDSTRDVLARFAGRIVLVRDSGRNLGVIGNFNALTAYADAEYTAFADQDDIWEPGKLAAQLTLMRELEYRHGRETPLLVHSDLALCDGRGRIISSSLWSYQRLCPDIQSFSRLLVQNNITGCTVMINAALKKLAFPVPEDAVMHDWWLALVASAVGKIAFVRTPLVCYRQHGRNQMGAVRGGLRRALYALRHVDPQKFLGAAQRQAQVFHEVFAAHPAMGDVVRTAAAYGGIRSQPYFERLLTLCRHGLWKQDALRNIGLVVSI